MKPEETIDFNIRWAWHRIARMYNTEAAKYGMTMSVGYVLLNIDMEEGTPSTKLGPKMGMEPRSLTRILKSIEEKGLIERKSDKQDGRMVRIHLTEKGLDAREVSRETVLKFNHFIYDNIPKKKLKGFFEVVGKLSEILENNDIFNNHEKKKN
ncbi:MAG: MarR family transcriptional regulator [Flavobacteriales bacterium]|nr:MAG: MarR family transcriptional regulator [Flavobacteriales bacterium]